jgi:uncharacterized membrane protein HdeD (DUF308 family)
MARKQVHVFEEDDKGIWWMFVLTGLVSVVFGFVSIIWPRLTVGVFALLIAVFIGINGVIDLSRSMRKMLHNLFSGTLRALLGLLEIGVAVYLLRHVGSNIAIATLALFIAISFVTRGIVGIVLAYDAKISSSVRMYHFITGGLAVLAGLVVAWYPGPATLAWVWVVGFFALVSGAMEITIGYMIKESLESK